MDNFAKESFSTHRPILCEALLRTNGKIIEFGCGYGSTPILHNFCMSHDRKLVTVESSYDWLRVFSKDACQFHELILVKDWDDFLKGVNGSDYAFAFVDQEPWSARVSTILALKDKTRFIILHDCDYFVDNGLISYDDTFKFHKQYTPPKPWPFPSGPPTLLGSNFASCDWEISEAAIRMAEG
jgi:hypothetical protein